MNARASSKVAITGGAIRRSNWHWQVLKFQTPDGSCNRLTLTPAPSDAPHYTPPGKPVNGFVQKLVLAGLFAVNQGSSIRVSSCGFVDRLLCPRQNDPRSYTKTHEKNY